jgi:hypothetical protein
MNFPSRHAWNLFLLVNHPAKDPKLGRGLPDLSKSIGTSGTTSVWETWRLTGTEVCLKDGAEPPQDFNDNSLAGNPVTGKVPEPPKHVLLAKLAATESPSSISTWSSSPSSTLTEVSSKAKADLEKVG